MSDEETAFLAVLAASPTDDTTRLVYADWLDERNDPRARYLRLVCSLVGMPEQDLVDSAASDELRALSTKFAPWWLEAAGARFELALLEFSRVDRERLVTVLERILTPLIRFQIEALVRAAPVALRSELTYTAAFDLHWEWRRYRDWFSTKQAVVIRPIPTPYFSECGLFDVTLHKLPWEFWPNWPSTYKQPVSSLLNLSTREAADRVRKLPAVLFRGLRESDVEPTLARIRRAFNQRGCDLLSADALAVTPHCPPAET
jgi:uncharacterized protein (TIGR02996 family)